MLRQAIIEQWEERFGEDDPIYTQDKIKKVTECKSYGDLIYHCMSIDIDGHHVIAGKIGMSHRDLAFLLSAHRAMDQGHTYQGINGFYYKEEVVENDDGIIYSYTYPDETVTRYKSVKKQ